MGLIRRIPLLLHLISSFFCVHIRYLEKKKRYRRGVEARKKNKKMWGDVILICGLFSSLLFGYLNPLKLKSKILILIIGWMIFMVIEIGLEVNESEHGKREAAGKKIFFC